MNYEDEERRRKKKVLSSIGSDQLCRLFASSPFLLLFLPFVHFVSLWFVPFYVNPATIRAFLKSLAKRTAG